LFVKKRLIFPYYCTGIEQTIFKKIDYGSKQFVKHLTARIKNFVWHFTGNKSAKMEFLLQKYLLPKCKKSLKKRGNFLPIACTIVKHFIDIYQANKTLVQTHSSLKTENWFIGLPEPLESMLNKVVPGPLIAHN
jgi:hypothetical protein